MKRYIETGTVDHMLRVSAEPLSGDFPGWVNITQFEGSCRHGKYTPLRYRLRAAWRTLRGNGRCWEEMYEADGVDRLVAALIVARAEAFGPREAMKETTTSMQEALQ